jgi:hypothetical protein
VPNDASITVRISNELRRALDEEAAKLRRSRSFVVNEALEQRLTDRGGFKHRPPQRTPDERRAGFEKILEIGRRNAHVQNYKNAQEVIDFIREIRGDD